MNNKRNKLQTLLLHGGYDPDEYTGATALPIYQSSSFSYKTAEELEDVFSGRSPGYIYSRINNPTLQSLERRMTTIEEGLGGVSCSSGLSAITLAILALTEAGDEIISGYSIFGGTYSLFHNTLRRYGIRTRFVESTSISQYEESITPKTKLIFVETIGNPRLDVPNIKAISEIAKKNNIVLIVDNTVTTPFLFQPKKSGADIVIHSTTKYINGHGNSIGGIIIDLGTFDWDSNKYPAIKSYYRKTGEFAFITFLRNNLLKDLGCALSPFNAFLTSIGLESLAVRMERHTENAFKAAIFFEKDKRVSEVRYPGLPSHPDYKIAKKQFGLYPGALLTLRLGTKDRCYRFINNLKITKNLANLGDTKTLVIHPASTFCKDATVEERKRMGVTDDLVRLSIGIEAIEDLFEDFNEALKYI